MKTSEELKKLVQEKYSEIAEQSKEDNMSSCCGAGGCSTEVYNIMSDDYTNIEGYAPEADLGLGCGLPTEYAGIKPGDTVIDLGSGAGNDCFIARNEVGADGRVIGIDFTPSMIERAKQNAQKLGFKNVEFRQGDIERIPVTAGTANVIISNCVLNLVPDKQKVFKEIYRVLKPKGHFSISDVVVQGELPRSLKKDAEMYAGCVSGAIEKDQYLQYISQAGFSNIRIQKIKPIYIPADILKKYLNETEITNMQAGSSGIFSITVYAKKPENCCADTPC